MTDDTLRKFTRDELLIVAARTGKSIIFDIETDAGDRLRDPSRAYGTHQFTGFIVFGDPKIVALADKDDRRFMAFDINDIPIPAPTPKFEPREKPSHKLTTFERMRQGQRSKRDMVRRAMERRS